MAEGTRSTARAEHEAQTLRVRHILAAVESLRELHGELCSPLRWAGIERVLAREEVALIRVAMRRRADVFCSLGVSVISINSSVPKRGWTKLAAHEYGHIKLHLADHFEGHEIVRNLSPCRKGDRREYEAELFALLLLRGPDASLDDPDLARLVKKIDAPPRVQQLQMPLPQKATLAGKHRIDPDDHLSWLLKRRRRDAEHRSKVLGSSGAPEPISDDTARVEYRKGGVFYTSPDDRRWRIYDFVHGWHPEGNNRKVPVSVGDPTTKVRYFVNSIGERRRYIFGRRELRDIRVKHLDRQIREASPMRRSSRSAQSPDVPQRERSR